MLLNLCESRCVRWLLIFPGNKTKLEKKDEFPTDDGGIDFIILQLWNKNTVKVPIKNIQVNGILHTWDTKTRNVVFDADGNPPLTGRFPEDVKFSIIPHSNGGSLIQFGNQTVVGDQEVRLVIKPSPNVKGDLISEDIGLGKPLQILVNIGDVQPAEFIILTGETK